MTNDCICELVNKHYNDVVDLVKALAADPFKSWEVWTSADPLVSATWVMIKVSLLCFVLSQCFGNNSQTDRLWSIMPPVYCWHFFLMNYLKNNKVSTRMLIMAVFVTIWGSRLTYNFWRKGGYNLKDEDYRWVAVRKWFPCKSLYTIFDFCFISFYQHFLLLAITVPIYYVHKNENKNNSMLGFIDYFGYILFIAMWFLEAHADQEQWEFYKKREEFREKKGTFSVVQKREYDKKDDVAVGFNRSGLFSISRHPNFLGEQTIWWAFYVFSVATTRELINCSILGTVLLTLLFQGSTYLTEKLTVEKYPCYAVYQQRVNRFFPIWNSLLYFTIIYITLVVNYIK